MKRKSADEKKGLRPPSQTEEKRSNRHESHNRFRRHRPAHPRVADPGAQLRRPETPAKRASFSSLRQCRRTRSEAAPATLHKFDLEKRKLDKVLEGVAAFDVSANGEKMLYRQGPNWMIAGSNVGTPAPPGSPGSAKRSEDCGHGGLRRSRSRVEADVPRSRGASSATSSTTRTSTDSTLQATKKNYEPYLDGRRASRRSELSASTRCSANCRSATLTSGAATRPIRTVSGRLARRGLQDRERPLSLRQSLQRRELEPAAARAAHATRRRRQGRRIPARRQRPRSCASTDNVYSFFEATANKQVSDPSRPESRRHGLPRSDGRAGCERERRCATWPGSKATAARWIS